LLIQRAVAIFKGDQPRKLGERMEKRKLGKTGEQLSVVGFGGVLAMNEEPAAIRSLVSEAIDRGINYFDVAPSYGDAEEKLGPALEPYRNSCFLACKTGKRDGENAEKELNRSLERLRTDHFDLYQFHSVTTQEDVDQIVGSQGALEVALRAREAGKVRYIGFSAHSERAALTLLDRYPFDTILFPVSWVTWHQGNFGAATLKRAKDLGIGLLALKALAKRKWEEGEERKWKKCWYAPVDTFEEAKLALRFTLSKGMTAAVSPGHAELFRWACDAADSFSPLSEEEEEEVAAKSAGLAPIFATP
jgi:predicted aldo/keto reductase-like oxidoreductase